MKITQLYTLVNSVTKELLGETTVVNEDLSNIVDVGKAVMDQQNGVDNYVRKLVDHIGKVIFVNRAYAGGAPSVLMDSWEFGSVLEKVSADLPEASENDSWNLQDGQEYSQDVFYQPKVEAKFYNSKVTFEVKMSFAEKQVKSAFSSAEQLNGFISMLVTAVENSLTVKLDALIMRAINNMTAETINGADANQVINLLAGFNVGRTTPLTADSAITDPDFIRYASYQIGLYTQRMGKISTLFNAGAKARFTPKDKMHIVLLSDFSAAAGVYLDSDTQNKELVALPEHESVPYWQGSGTGYTFDDVSSIDVKTASGATVKQSGIIGLIFDRDAVGVANLDRRVTTAYNARAEFYTNFYKLDAGFFNDTSENFVVFYVAD